MKKVIGYIRVSTEYQKLKENSINNQIKSINEYCNRNDFDLVEIFEDNGISGLISMIVVKIIVNMCVSI